MIKRHLLYALLISVTYTSYGKNVGVVGTVYQPIEVDMTQWIQHKLAALEASGQWAAIKQQQQETVRARITRPHPVSGLTTTSRPRQFYIDPTVTLKRDIKDSTGKTLFHKGRAINPFDTTTWPNGAHLPPVQLSKKLAFLDGDDPQQLAWAIATKKQTIQPIKWILIKGEPEATFDVLQQRIYFDQNGSLSHRFRLHHVPVLIAQDHHHWKVQEFDVSHYAPVTP